MTVGATDVALFNLSNYLRKRSDPKLFRNAERLRIRVAMIEIKAYRIGLWTITASCLTFDPKYQLTSKGTTLRRTSLLIDTFLSADSFSISYTTIPMRSVYALSVTFAMTLLTQPHYDLQPERTLNHVATLV